MSGDVWWYRFEDVQTEDGRPRFHLMAFTVIKTTPRGVWLGYGSRKRFVLNDARKRYAYPTQSEAWESMVARRSRERAILRARSEYVANALEEMKKGVPHDVPVYPQGYWRFEA